MEDAILSAIAAMNEPKTCSTTALKKYILENHPGTNSNFQGKVPNYQTGSPPPQLWRRTQQLRMLGQVCATYLNYLVELAREQTAPLCATEVLSVFNSHEFLSSLTTFWDVMHVSLVYSTFLGRWSSVSTTFLILNCRQYFSLCWKAAAWCKHSSCLLFI